MIKWLPAAGYIATSRLWSGGALTGPPGPVQAYFESQCSASWEPQCAPKLALEQAQPARNVCQWHGAVPVPLLGSGSGSLICTAPDLGLELLFYSHSNNLVT